MSPLPLSRKPLPNSQVPLHQGLFTFSLKNKTPPAYQLLHVRPSGDCLRSILTASRQAQQGYPIGFSEELLSPICQPQHHLHGALSIHGSHRTAGCVCKPRVSCVCAHTPGFRHLLGRPRLTLLSPLFMFCVISKRDFRGYALVASEAAAQTGEARENRELGVRREARAFSPLLCCRVPPLCAERSTNGLGTLAFSQEV